MPRPPPASAPPWLASALFGRSLCGGQVLKALRPLAADFEPRARLLTDAATSDRAVMALRELMSRRRIEGRRSLASAWEDEPTLLLRELSRILPEPRRATLVELWPKLLVLAERAASK